VAAIDVADALDAFLKLAAIDMVESQSESFLLGLEERRSADAQESFLLGLEERRIAFNMLD
jgi:hypothetical protein